MLFDLNRSLTSERDELHRKLAAGTEWNNHLQTNASNMKTTTLVCAALALAPVLAHGHPGHSVLDFTAGPPHAGHESEIGTLLVATALTVALFAGARWLTARRR